MNFITYCRVSTDKQGENGLGMDAQRDAVELHARRSGGAIIAAYVEVESGKKNDRPQLARAMAHAKATGAVLLIAKLDRLARNVAFISALMESGVEFVAADMPTANRLTIHILAAVAEHEREMISQRTKAALAVAKSRGAQLGGKRPGSVLSPEKIRAASQARKDDAILRASSVRPMIVMAQQSGATTLQQIADKLNAAGVPASRGGIWSAMQVSRILKAGQ